MAHCTSDHRRRTESSDVRLADAVLASKDDSTLASVAVWDAE